MKKEDDGKMFCQQVSILYACPVKRVKGLINQGVLKARKGPHSWRIDPSDITLEIEMVLKEKKKTWRGFEPDHGNHNERYGLCFINFSGKTYRIPKEWRERFSREEIKQKLEASNGQPAYK